MVNRGPASRSKQACGPCRNRHLKCDGMHPCMPCQKKALNCTYVAELSTFTPREWNTTNDGPGFSAVAPPRRSNSSIAFVNETRRVQNNYTVIADDLVAPSSSPAVSPPQFLHTHSSPASIPSPALQQTETNELPGPLTPITSPTDAFFMSRYGAYIGPWFDLFDSRRRFSLIVPHLALRNQLLMLSALACAARQHHLTSAQPVKTALTYYEGGLQLLGAALKDFSESSSAAVFASCLLLAHCEMIGASTRDWHLHLSGTLSLVTTHGWNRCTEGLGQACLWIYHRMDILSSLATAEHTRIQTTTWDLAGDQNPSTIESWSNHTVLLLAEIHNLLCEVRESQHFSPVLFDRWQELGMRVERHEQLQPLEFQPLAVLDADPTHEQNPFPSVYYLNAAVSAAMQMFDLARFLLILARPERSHAERATRLMRNGDIAEIFVVRVIANSIVNRESTSWVNAVQLLHSAGMALVGWIRRKALLQCLEDIQLETGWNTQHNIQALLDWWGWSGPLQHQSWKDVHSEIGPRQRIGDLLLHVFNVQRVEDNAASSPSSRKA